MTAAFATDFTAVNARARGLTAHLFTRVELKTLATHDPPNLARALARHPKLPAPSAESLTPNELDRLIRHTARQHLRTLSRWEGGAPVLAVFFADQDRRSLRALLRGALATSPADERLAGLIPTPTLPERVLAELARQPTPAAIAAHLLALSHASAERLLPLTAEAQPDLLALELALTQSAAERATREAARGDANLRRYVAQRIDLANVQSALLLATERDVPAASCFVEGGREFPLPAFLSVVGEASSATALWSRLGQALRHTSLAPLTAEVAVDASRWDRAAFSLVLATQRAVARLEPLSSAPLLSFLLRLEGQGRDLRRLLWGAVLGAPASLLEPDLVTP